MSEPGTCGDPWHHRSGPNVAPCATCGAAPDPIARDANEKAVASRFAGELVDLCRARGMPIEKRAQALEMVEPMVLAFVLEFLQAFEAVGKDAGKEPL